MQKIGLKATVAALALVALAGCGETKTDRAISGGAIGAAGGAVGGALMGSPAAGALTSPDDIDLGKPIWKR